MAANIVGDHGAPRSLAVSNSHHFWHTDTDCFSSGTLSKTVSSHVKTVLRAIIITHSPAQQSACKDLGRNGQSPAITLKAAYTPIANRAGSRSLSITRSPAQQSACKDLKRNGQRPAITLKATYTPIANRAGSRSLKKSLQLPQVGNCKLLN